MPTEKQRREAERRRLRRQLQRRARREARRRQFAVIASVVGALVVIAIVVTVVVATGNDKSTPGAGSAGSTSAAATTPTTPVSTAAPAAYPCTWTRTGAAARPVSVPPTTTPPRTGTVDVLVQTSLGPMTFQLDRAEAPCAAESFQSLAEQQYFANTTCHRLTSGSLSVLQCGDPTGTGSGGPGYSFADELNGKEKYTRGVLAMANAGPNTNGSQFFIVYKNSTLAPNYTIFGKVTSGMGIVDKVAAKGSTPKGDGKPNLPIRLEAVSVVQ